MKTDDGPFLPHTPTNSKLLSSSPPMLLVQKQPNFSLNPLPLTYHHRRHPSAPPAVVFVQPTRTPGLLSLSKPQLQRYQPQQRTPRTPVLVKSTPAVPTATPLSPSPAQRGRQTKDKAGATFRYCQAPILISLSFNSFLLGAILARLAINLASHHPRRQRARSPHQLTQIRSSYQPLHRPFPPILLVNSPVEDSSNIRIHNHKLLVRSPSLFPFHLSISIRLRPDFLARSLFLVPAPAISIPPYYHHGISLSVMTRKMQARSLTPNFHTTPPYRRLHPLAVVPTPTIMANFNFPTSPFPPGPRLEEGITGALPAIVVWSST